MDASSIKSIARKAVKGLAPDGFVRYGTSCDILVEDKGMTTLVVGLLLQRQQSEDIEYPIPRYMVRVAKSIGAILKLEELHLDGEELSSIVRNAGLGTLKDHSPINAGAFSVTYKVSVEETIPKSYIIQLRWRGNLDSIYTLTTWLSANCRDSVPVPDSHRIQFRSSHGFLIQTSSYIDGIAANEVYPTLPTPQKVTLVRQIARAFKALWKIDVTGSREVAIGEAIAAVTTKNLTISVGPHRMHDLGGPFDSAKSYIRAWLHHCLEAYLRRCNDNDNFVRGFVESKLDASPADIDTIPIVLVHTDMGLHNMIVSNEPIDIILKSIIDWESVHCLPFLVTVPLLVESLFVRRPRCFDSIEYPDARMLRKAFWMEVGEEFKLRFQSLAACSFLRYYCFGLFLAKYVSFHCIPRQESDVKFLWKTSGVIVERFIEM
ncbi:hypothetical protein M430DRAFT_23119 [Amorphotheca resinae ATCC 22711]|uniref:Aminoglycoside phosphotransferase domain-containing protein n=1 Tax=Amorphotheca resinae ATCC 22711 TaxID=857342 RepID=A0A2T3APM8_AMORE|nr:hypothetical protein M430DRAFT_23119 [Amorphotheca resinae ATCC 22711]PSS06963.1 hypothetical protein M430DRAFT_23119 [Amorphotheca resinae ATCC 22711]